MCLLLMVGPPRMTRVSGAGCAQGARHNTQLCSNRLVTEAGLPAEGPAGLHERLVVPAR